MTRAQNLLEAIKFSSTKTASGDQRITYWAKLMANKYQLGKLNEYAITKDWSITGYTFGPIGNTLGKGKWLHLVATVTNKGSDRGAFTHYTVTDQKEKIVFVQDKFITDRSNSELAEVPLEVKGARHIIALAVGQGETNGATVLGKIKLEDVKKNFNINKRFDMVAQLVRVVASKQLPGMLITGCFSGDTEVMLLDGTNVRMDQLSSVPEDRRWTYSVDKDGQDVAGQIRDVWSKGVMDTVIVEVTNKYGETIKYRCTPDHKFLLRSGEWKRADELTAKDSLRSMYTFVANSGYYNGYEHVNQQPTHHMVSKSIESLHKVKGQHLHHSDHNKLNNLPSNLEVLSHSDHFAHHAQLDNSEVQRERFYHKFKGVDISEEQSRISLSQWYNEDGTPKEERMDQARSRMIEFNSTHPRKRDEITYDEIVDVLMTSDKVELSTLTEYFKCSRQAIYNRIDDSWSNFKSYILEQKSLATSNHTVVAVTPAEPVEVWDLSVAEHENFTILDQGSEHRSGVVVHNSGGLGKTYTVMSVLEMMGFQEDVDYFLVKGAKLTPIAFYETIHEHQDKLIILDDSDTILGNGDVRNMLKAALDTSGTRTMTYVSPAVESKGLPTKFEFNGQLIVISNKKITDFDQPFISRVVPVDVTMTREETLQRMEFIVGKGVPKDVNCDVEDMTAAFKLLKDFVVSQGDSEDVRPKDLNMRTVIKLAILHKSLGDAFSDVATYQLLNS